MAGQKQYKSYAQLPLFTFVTKMVIQRSRRRQSWPIGDFPMGPSRAQLREVRRCLEYFARSENVPYRIRRHDSADEHRTLDYVTPPVRRIDFFMLHGIVVSIKLQYLSRSFLNRYCLEVLVHRRSLPLRFAFT